MVDKSAGGADKDVHPTAAAMQSVTLMSSIFFVSRSSYLSDAFPTICACSCANDC
jgi:hypothetical protein